MKVFLIKKEDLSVIDIFENVISYNYMYVEFLNGGYASKRYCNTDTEYFSENEPVVEAE